MKHLCSLLLIFIVSGVGSGQPDQKPIRLTLRPKASPVPALKYSLLPELRDRTPGNAALLYYRSFSPDWQIAKAQNQEMIAKWRQDPRQVPDKMAADVVKKSKRFRELDRAARRAYCDWELLPRIREEGAGLLLPDLQALRESAWFVAMRMRVHIAEGNHAQAHRTLQTGLSMARDIGNGPSLIHYLIGVAIAHQFCPELEEWIQSEGSPNLYWSLATAPDPLVDLRTNLEGERLFLDQMFPGYREVLENPKVKRLPPIHLDDLTQQFFFASSGLQIVPSKEITLQNWGNRMGMGVRVAFAYPQARELLIQRGVGRELIESASMLQVFMLAEILEYDRLLDEMRKWVLSSSPQATQELAKIDEVVRKNAQEQNRGTLLARMFLPSLQSVIDAKLRLKRRLIALQTIEALRLHAAQNRGQFPEKLSDITLVPVPNDPVTNQPFGYEMKGDRAKLTGAPFGKSRTAIHYELELQSK